MTDVDGASNYTTANITILPSIDNPPIAKAGSAKKLVWPHNHVILYGNASFDDNVCQLFVLIVCLFTNNNIRELFPTSGRNQLVLLWT